MEKQISYKGYEIELREESPGQWKAHIRRADGKLISTAPFGPTVPVISTMDFHSSDDALREAKIAIDAGGMK